jgi:hypothetical protein
MSSHPVELAQSSSLPMQGAFRSYKENVMPDLAFTCLPPFLLNSGSWSVVGQMETLRSSVVATPRGVQHLPDWYIYRQNPLPGDCGPSQDRGQIPECVARGKVEINS